MADQLALPILPYINRGLFSDHYLSRSVPQEEGWQYLRAEAMQTQKDLRVLFDHIRPDRLDEAQLENQWVQPILERLGHPYAVQVKIRYRDTGFRRPDYVIARDTQSVYELTGDIYTPDELQTLAVAVGDAKRWGTPLDRATGYGQRNPSQQIDEYLRYSELSWGILTDGRFWRLYERDSSKDNRYYAVDLVELLRGDAEGFLYFYTFFRHAAFAENWLTTVLKGSQDYAQRISDQLENQVYDALKLIAQGFLVYRRNRLRPEPATLQQIYEQSLVLLYRLLFVLYAESREILPLANKAYLDRQSFDSIKREVIFARRRRQGLDADHSLFYARLNDLFFHIDQGNPTYDLPAYNGRLFAAEEHPFLASKAVGDEYLVPALDKMARVDGARDFEFIDYRDLEIRHLGAIYEKLLEYRLDYAQAPLTVKDGKYTRAASGDKEVVKAGEVYLRTDNHERKVSGSYYTPDYIVRFIVEQTLEPLLREITERYASLDETGHWQVYNRETLVDAVLALNILDPATGSGHFMVEAAAYIAEWLRELAIPPLEDFSEEDELVYWKRQVVNSCIYGVDLNPLAVELAKLSLWLATLAAGKPLTFLDHHLKIGNSLVGARAAEIDANLVEISAEKGTKTRPVGGENQPLLFELENFSPAVRFAVEEMTQIEGMVAETVETVKRQEARYANLQEEMRRWKQIAHLWTARYFGLTILPEQWQAARAALLNGDQVNGELATLMRDAETVADAYHFFHWDLEFPEVFFTPQGETRPDGGFDAVLGNPPYVRQERIQPLKPYLELKYQVFQGTADLFLYFFERGLSFLKSGRRLGYITSGTYMNSNSASAFRRYVHEHAALESTFNFGENQPFNDAEMVFPTIAILRKGRPAPTFRAYFMEGAHRPAALERVFEELLISGGVDASSDVTSHREWRFQGKDLTDLLAKLTLSQMTLTQAVNGQIYYGIKTGLNDAFIIDSITRNRLIAEDETSVAIIKPLLRGQDLRPWYQENSGEFLIFANRGVEIDRFPAVKRYLEDFRERLEPKPAAWNDKHDGTWLGRAAGSYKWYELQGGITYAAVFDNPKIVVPDIGKLPRFSWEDRGYYLNDKGTAIVPESGALLAVLNSRPLWFVLSQMATPLRLRAGLWQYQAKIQFVERLPIPALTSEQERELGEIAETITQNARARYHLHEQVRHRIRQDLGEGGALNQKLGTWWDLTLPSLRAEVQKAFKRDIPLKERDEWEKYLPEQQARHRQLTADIIMREERLNAIVYAAFQLTPEECTLIEKVTKYHYGEV